MLQRGLLGNKKAHLRRGSASQQVTSFKDGNSEVLDLPPSSGEKEGRSLWKVLLKFMAIQACHLQKKKSIFDRTD